MVLSDRCILQIPLCSISYSTLGIAVTTNNFLSVLGVLGFYVVVVGCFLKR